MQVRIRGRVQGVFYRDTTRRAALRLGVHGWVRNRSDGSVEGHFEGKEGAVETLLARCREGPPGARVDAVEVRPVATVGHAEFAIVAVPPDGPLR